MDGISPNGGLFSVIPTLPTDPLAGSPTSQLGESPPDHLLSCRAIEMIEYNSSRPVETVASFI